LKSRIAIFRGGRQRVALAVVPLLIVSGCAGQGGMENVIKTDTGKGALLGSAGGAAIGAIVDSANPWAGVLIGASNKREKKKKKLKKKRNIKKRRKKKNKKIKS
jgi:hypothetical protein